MNLDLHNQQSTSPYRTMHTLYTYVLGGCKNPRRVPNILRISGVGVQNKLGECSTWGERERGTVHGGRIRLLPPELIGHIGCCRSPQLLAFSAGRASDSYTCGAIPLEHRHVSSQLGPRWAVASTMGLGTGWGRPTAHARPTRISCAGVPKTGEAKYPMTPARHRHRARAYVPDAMLDN